MDANLNTCTAAVFPINHGFGTGHTSLGTTMESHLLGRDGRRMVAEEANAFCVELPFQEAPKSIREPTGPAVASTGIQPRLAPFEMVACLPEQRLQMRRCQAGGAVQERAVQERDQDVASLLPLACIRVAPGRHLLVLRR
eukprot:846378-Rhodomonas_salina.2